MTEQNVFSAGPARRALVVAALAALAGCGGGPSTRGSTAGAANIAVQVSAGAPVAGAQVTIYAVNESTGETNTAIGERGAIARGGPTDASGKAIVKLTVKSYAGPVQVVAGGQGVSYVDPTVAPPEGAAPRVIQVPATFEFSSFVANFNSATATTIPATLYTTLADHAAIALSRGLVPSHPERVSVVDALTARDPLFVKHFTPVDSAWAPTALRTTVPAMLTEGPVTLVDIGYAALPDLSLNQLARDVAVAANYGTDSQAVNAITLVQLLEQDIDADGVLDGRAEGGRPVAVIASPPVPLDSLFLRKNLAQSLYKWIRNPAVNRSGITSAELAASQVYAAISTDTSDLFGNAAVELFDPTDHAAPVVSLAGTGSVLYSRDGNLTLRVRAEDASGVKSVSAAVGGNSYSGALGADGMWSIAVKLPAVGHNPVTVWGDDNSESGSNSGLGVAGHQLALDVVYDPTPPSATYDAEFASYVDERTVTVATGTDGRAKVPAIYASTQGKTAIPRGGHIYKASTRLAAMTPLSAGELEGANAGNIPVLRFAVPCNAGTDAPIVQANFSAAVTCSGCPALPTATGALLASAATAPQQLLFELPLATDLVPALGRIVGPGSVSVQLSLADGAGNTATVGPFDFTFHVVGPPIAAQQDASYATMGATNSTFPYKLADNSYATLWNPGTRFGSGVVRLVRYVLSNPSPQPVAVAPTYQQAPDGSWQAVETWQSLGTQDYPEMSLFSPPSSAKAFAVDGFTFYQPLYWMTPWGAVGEGNTIGAAFPCPNLLGSGYPGHRLGETARQWTCITDDEISSFKWFTHVGSKADVTPVVYRGPAPDGLEGEIPAKDVTGTLSVIPGASANAPGTLVLYIARPVGAPQTRELLWNRRSSTNHYQTWDYEAFEYNHQSGQYAVFNALRAGKDLMSAADVLSGTLSVSTQGLLDEAAIGEAAPRFSAGFSSTTIATH